MVNVGTEKPAAVASDLSHLVEKVEALSHRAAKLERIADDLLLLAPSGQRPSVAAMAQADLADPAWEAAGLPALTIGVRELVIFSALLALGVGAAFFFGYVASIQLPGIFD